MSHRLAHAIAIDVSGLTERVTALEELVAKLHSIDEPTLERCIATIMSSLDEVSDVLSASASVTGDGGTLAQIHAVATAKNQIRALDALLHGKPAPETKHSFKTGDSVLFRHGDNPPRKAVVLSVDGEEYTLDLGDCVAVCGISADKLSRRA